MNDQIVLVSVGNTRTRLALARGKQLDPSAVLPNSDVPAIVEAVVALARGGGAKPPTLAIETIRRPC